MCEIKREWYGSYIQYLKHRFLAWRARKYTEKLLKHYKGGDLKNV